MASSHPDNLHSNHLANVTASFIGSHGKLDNKNSYHSALQGSHNLRSDNEGGYNVKSQTYFNPRQQQLAATVLTLNDEEHNDKAYVSNDVMV